MSVNVPFPVPTTRALVVTVIYKDPVSQSVNFFNFFNFCIFVLISVLKKALIHKFT